MATRKWTVEQRKKQSLKISQWQPWQLSTGAKTIEGKAKASRNAFKGGFKKQLCELNKLLKEQHIELNRDYLFVKFNQNNFTYFFTCNAFHISLRIRFI